jgi:hypothetical protein
LHTRTVSPSAHPRPASVELRTSSRLAPSRRHQQALRPPGGEDARCVRPISATQTNYVHPHLARSRLAHAAFAAGTPHGDSGSVRIDRGTGRFTTSEDRFGGSSVNADLELYCLTAWRHERGRYLPTALRATEPLAPLSRAPVHPHASLAFASAACLAVRPPFERVGTGRRVRRPPRPPLTPARESLRLVMIRDAFHQ